MIKNVFKSKCKINHTGVTNDMLTGRGGMALFVKYLSSVEIYRYYKIFLEISEEIRKVCQCGIYSSRYFVGFTMERVVT